VKDYEHSTALYGVLMAINCVIVILMELPMISIVKRFRMTYVIGFGFLLYGLGRGLVGVSGGGLWLTVTIVVTSFGEIIAFPVILAFVSDLSPAHLRGRYQSVPGLIDAIGITVGPVIGGILYEWNHRSVWVTCAIFGVLAFGLMLMIRPVAPAAAREAVVG
jgi:MFS family permease